MASEPQASILQTSHDRLAGKVAVVTGGNRGIGLAIARALVAEQCNVVLGGRDSTAIAEAAAELQKFRNNQQRILPLACDVRNADAVEELFASVNREFETLDILVNNAGISQSPAPVEHTRVELWREIIDTNLTGTFLCTRAAIPLMSRGSTILNVLSVAARDCFPNFSPYNASKAGALGFTFTARRELQDRGIRVTALLPGATDTDIWEQVMPDAPREKMIAADTIAALVLEAVVLSPKANPFRIGLGSPDRRPVTIFKSANECHFSCF